jgi:hypothetical protein
MGVAQRASFIWFLVYFDLSLQNSITLYSGFGETGEAEARQALPNRPFRALALHAYVYVGKGCMSLVYHIRP